jgi:hypothetical protein
LARFVYWGNVIGAVGSLLGAFALVFAAGVSLL